MVLDEKYINELVNTIASKWDEADHITKQAYIYLMHNEASGGAYDDDTETETFVFSNGTEVYVQYDPWGQWELTTTE